MTSPHRRILGTAALFLTVMTGCGEPAADTIAPTHGQLTGPGDAACSVGDDVRAVAIILPVHQGAAAGVPAQFRCIIRAAITRSLPIRVITAEGTPRVALKFQAHPDPVNPVAFEDDIQNAEAELLTGITALTAGTAGNDAWGAIQLAARELVSIDAGGTNGLILSRDNGTSDRGLLRTTEPGMTSAEPKEVAAFLTRNGGCEDLDGISLALHGLGETLAPHPALSARQKAALADQFQTSLAACGATATTAPLPATGTGTSPGHPTTPITPDPAIAFDVKARKISLRQDALGFAADKAEFLVPDRAHNLLRDLAAQLRDNPTTRVTIRGRTAAGPTAWPSLQALGRARAELCAQVLRDAGIHPTRISVNGAGYLADPPITGPATAALNRVTEFEFN